MFLNKKMKEEYESGVKMFSPGGLFCEQVEKENKQLSSSNFYLLLGIIVLIAILILKKSS